jgi:putative ABC transport system permease protein
MIGVALFYIFNSIGSQGAMMKLSKKELWALMGIDDIMSGLSVFVSTVLGFLILYANAFLVRRRKKEFGIYMLLGMKKFKISAILITETVLVGILSLAAGCAVGIFLSQWFAVITAKMLGISITGFTFVFSPAALVKCFGYFGLSFFVVMLFNTFIINKQKIINLIYASKKRITLSMPNIVISSILFIISVCILGYAYHIMLTTGIIAFFEERERAAQSLSIILGITGTFLFFYSLSGFVLRLISKLKGIYFRDLNIFTLKQIDSKIHRAYISMSFVCLMMFLAISAISVGSSLSEGIRNYRETEKATATIVSYMSLYIGIVFFVVCAGVLAISQLSDAIDNRERYILLSNLGADKKMISKSVFIQVSVYFAAPLILALSHSVVAIKVMNTISEILGSLNILTSSLVTGGVILLVYGGYFALTYLSARKSAV